MNDRFITPFLVGLNLTLGLIMWDYLNLVVAVLGALTAFLANAPRAIHGFEFVRAYVSAGFRLPTRQLADEGETADASVEPEIPFEGDDDDDQPQKQSETA